MAGDKIATISRLWLLKMAHINDLGLKELAKQGMSKGDQVAGLDKCESCIYEKAIEVKFNKTAIQSSKGPLDYIHSDL